jgi:DNA-binding beta-propeller fold protein YncE
MCARQAACASPVAWPLTSAVARLLWLRSCCAVAEGADVQQPRMVPRASGRCSPGVCVGAVLGDAERRVAVLGGREGMPRSLGSVYGGSVTRFLGGSCRGVASRVIDMPSMIATSNGVAVSCDGSTLLVSDRGCDDTGGSDAIHAFRVSDGSWLRAIGGTGNGPLEFKHPCQVWVASDDFVFVADNGADVVRVLTPRLDFHGFVGVGELNHPEGVCADDDVIVVSEWGAHRISVFRRGDGALLRRFGTHGRGDGQLNYPQGLCFMSGHRHVAVADCNNRRVSVFSVEGEFVRHVGVGELSYPSGVACSAFDEIVVADGMNNRRVVVFSASGELLHTMRSGYFFHVAVHGGTIFAQVHGVVGKCVVFT